MSAILSPEWSHIAKGSEMPEQNNDSLAALIGMSGWTGHGVNVRRVRDLVIMQLGETSFVIACDSNAATGDKPGDHLKQPPEVTGYSAAKVPLMEVLASGADPFLLINNLGVDLATTGMSLLRGIRRLLDETSLDLMITGSDESNMPTVQTGIGVTVIGVAATDELRVGRVRAGDEVWVLGRRRSGLFGDEYEEGDPGTATARHVASALRLPDIREILPVGSKGIAFEAGELARESGLRVELDRGAETDLDKSAGASTCFLVACDPGSGPTLDALNLPRERIGRAQS
jgi:thiamine monophosphate kinase